MSESPKPNDSQESPIQVFPAALSMVCPGLGQLTQGRTSAFFGHFLFFVLAACLPVMFGVVIFYKIPQFYREDATTLLVLFGITVIFPLLLALFSILDAAMWKDWKNGEKSRLQKHILYLFGGMVVFYAVGFFSLPTFIESKGPARRMMCMNNIKQIALAMLNYETARGSLPPAFTVDENGKPLHSWRVLILPYMEENELYRKIRLDEPWDSEYNRQFHSAKIPVFECSSNGIVGLYNPEFPHLKNENSCYYSVVIGEETAFPGARKVKLDDVQDGTSHTVLVVERLVPICWMDPNHEIIYETALEGTNRSLYGVGSAHEGGANVALCDGSIHFISDEADQEFWKAVLTIAENEKVK